MPKLTTFDPKTLAEQKIYETEVLTVGTIRYGKLTMRDMVAIGQVKDEIERSYTIVHRMLVKATPELTIEELADWPGDDFAAIFLHLVRVTDFRGEKSKSGSGSQRKPKTSG